MNLRAIYRSSESRDIEIDIRLNFLADVPKMNKLLFAEFMSLTYSIFSCFKFVDIFSASIIPKGV
jgi:hypothetical protein